MVSTAFVLAAPLIVQVLWPGGHRLVAGTLTRGSAHTSNISCRSDERLQISAVYPRCEGGGHNRMEERRHCPHTVTAVDKSFDSAVLDPGIHGSLSSERQEDVNYFCTLHPNMRAKLIVQ